MMERGLKYSTKADIMPTGRIDPHLAYRRKDTTMNVFSEMATTDCNLPKNCSARLQLLLRRPEVSHSLMHGVCPRGQE
jgi:hypothetical protein